MSLERSLILASLSSTHIFKKQIQEKERGDTSPFFKDNLKQCLHMATHIFKKQVQKRRELPPNDPLSAKSSCTHLRHFSKIHLSRRPTCPSTYLKDPQEFQPLKPAKKVA
jgi:hypothetical protein